MNVEIISIGNEILGGNIVDTNANYIIKKLKGINLNVQHVSAVADEESEIVAQLKEACQRSQIIITTGGLGPTEDDITFQSVAKTFQLNLVKYPEAERHMIERISKIGVSVSPSNLKQSFLPEGSICIINPYGTAPAMILEKEGKVIVSLPGVPLEMKNLLSEQIIPFLEKNFPNLEHIQSRIIRTSGLGESNLNDMIKDFIISNQKLNIGIYASPEDIKIQLNALAKTAEETKNILDEATRQLKVILGDYIFGYDNESLEEVTGNLLRRKKLSLAVAESCTGGMLGETLTIVPGSSDYFKGGIISYDGEIKEKLLGVPHTLLTRFGEVSEPVAKAMAEGVRKKCNSDIGLSITGIAGPTGGSQEKPVGLVYIGLADAGQTLVQKHYFHNGRQAIRLRSVRRALNMLRLHIIKG
ncbi:MAG: competence/damage-inducible protein A [Atribacterota bacterium]|jgi:nicotinamide-nucleotide amidase|nr:competence/damage-inducible protein A [Atribacterota bacterium]